MRTVYYRKEIQSIYLKTFVLGPKGIRVNAVAPGITETDMMKAVPKEVIEPMIERIPLRRLGQPEDIANAFVFLASDEASYITGVILSVDGMARS